MVLWMSGISENYATIRRIYYLPQMSSKLLHLAPSLKTGTSLASAFESIFEDTKYSRRRPVWVRTNKQNELLNKNIQDALKRKDIHFQACKNPDMKYSVVERKHRVIGYRLYKYRVFQSKMRTDTTTFCRNLSEPIMTRFTLGRAWRRHQRRFGASRMGQHVRVCDKIKTIKSSKAAEQNFGTEIFRIGKVIDRSPSQCTSWNI